MTETLLPVAILAGGLGTRLHPITEVIPKSLVEINGIPFIDHQLKLLSQNGIQQVVICASYLGEKIVTFVGKGERYGLHVDYSFDGPDLLGTAGALKQALPLLGNNFFVLYGDSYLECDYLAIQTAFLNSDKLGLMTLYANNNHWDGSNVEYRDSKIVAYDKNNRTQQMKHIDFGLGIFNKTAFQHIPEGKFCDLMVFYQLLLQKDQLAAYEVKQRFYEVGSFEGIIELSSYLATH